MEVFLKKNSGKLVKKIQNISNLATKAALTTVENKIPSVSNLVKKTDYNTKITEIENKLNNHNNDKYIKTPEFNTLAADGFNKRLTQANLITKTYFDVKLSSLNRKIAENKTKPLLVENEMNELKTFDLSYFIGKFHFEEDGAQKYLVLQPTLRYFKFITNTNYVSSWKSKGLSAETIKPSTTSDNSLTPTLNYYDGLSCSKQPKNSYTHRKVDNIYIVYELGGSISNDNDPAFKNCLLL